ncbi:magnesium transporter [Microbacterium aurantiacum]|uniref:Magnesium transporter MgtE n=1 Tax=Microbacterium aurantiacum TaxID=162393 RepID=A0ABT8FTI9_9MICO|nr:magnesium transporter [Microbacterium aurantiacum]MDN4464624.1 magnesium transporter [Microbacterium aurantiacum]
MDRDLRAVLALGDPRALDAWLEHTASPQERSDQLDELSDDDVVALAGALDLPTGLELFDGVEPDVLTRVLVRLPLAQAAGLLDAFDADVTADVLRDMRAEERERLLTAMGRAHSAVVRGLLSWPEDSAAAQMSPNAVTVRPIWVVQDAVRAIRVAAADLQADSHTAAYVYVTSADAQVVGVVTFRALVFAEPGTLVAQIMDEDVVTVDPLEDQEQAAAVLTDHRLLAVPVVDDDGVLLGLLTADDVADILEEETTEDAEKQGGSSPLDVPYLRASPWLLWRKRIVWLLVLFLAEMYTGTVLRHFEDELAQVVALSFFIPLLIGTGGNSGTQIATTLVRAMAVGEVRLRNVLLVLRKEMSTAVLVAASVAALAWVRALTLNVGNEVALTVTVTVAAIVLWSAFVASVLPLVLKRLGLDPAVVSAPMITTVVDGTGLIIYFTVAHLLIGALGG